MLRSFHWKDIMQAIKAAYPAYEIPPLGYDDKETPDVTPTAFDLTLKDSLVVVIRGIDAIFEGAIANLKRPG